MIAIRGRRPGGGDTRAQIVEAARESFAVDGYASTSIRAVARRAGVDPALVHHYFDGKAELFVEAMALPVDPRAINEHVSAGPFDGVVLIERFLAQWEDGAPGGPASFVSLAQAITSSPAVADSVREFLAERIGVHGLPDDELAVRLRRRSLISSQLLGIAWTRYVMRIEPMASASRAEVARWAGPTIDRYATGPMEA